MKPKPHFLLLLLASPLHAVPVPSFKAVVIDAQIQIGYGIAVADVNGDKRPDILLADKNQIVWYENPSWTKHVMTEQLTARDHVCIAAQDIDGDGKCEVAVGAGWNPGDTLNSGAVFYLIPPADRTQKWEAVALPHEPTVHRMRWITNTSGRHDLLVVPLHGRGNQPATGEGEGAKLLIYHKPTDPRSPWTTEVLDDTLHKTHNFDRVQWDGKMGDEILVGSLEGLTLIKRIAGKTVRTLIAGGENGGVGEVRAGKFARGKPFLATVEPMHGNTLAIYTPPASGGSKALWTRQVLDESLVEGHALACGDFSGSGVDQIVVGWRGSGKPGTKVGIKLFTPLDAAGKQWRQTLIDDDGMACEDLLLADLNGDGRLDIIAAGRGTKNLKIYLNQGVK